MQIEIRRTAFGAGLLALSALLGCHEERPTAGAGGVATAPPSAAVAATVAEGGRTGDVAHAGASAGGTIGMDAGADSKGGSAVVPPAAAALPVAVARISAATIAPASLKAAVTANNAFATALFGQLRVQGPNENLLTSPISATLALSMTYAGAEGRTRTEMATALHFGTSPARPSSRVRMLSARRCLLAAPTRSRLPPIAFDGRRLRRRQATMPFKS